MKSLILVRHAKSSWDSGILDDFSRPLNQRGKSDIPLMAKRLLHHQSVPDIILHSAAVRTTLTAEGLTTYLGRPIPIRSLRKLYMASVSYYLDALLSLHESLNKVMVVGHNPISTELINDWSDVTLDNLPTLGMACIEVEEWKQLGQKRGKIQWLEYPRMFK